MLSDRNDLQYVERGHFGGLVSTNSFYSDTGLCCAQMVWLVSKEHKEKFPCMP